MIQQLLAAAKSLLDFLGLFGPFRGGRVGTTSQSGVNGVVETCCNFTANILNSGKHRLYRGLTAKWIVVQ